MKNPIAVALGKLAKGKPKNYSKDELERRRKLIEKLNLNRAKIKLETAGSAYLTDSEWRLLHQDRIKEQNEKLNQLKSNAKLPRKRKPKKG